MLYVSARSKWFTVFGLTSLLILSGCSTGKSASGDASSTSVSNVSGKVSSTSSSSLSKPTTAFGKAVQALKVGSLAVSGCTVQALDLTTNAVVATARSDSSGNYTLTGVTKGTTYKIVAVCGADSYSSIATAVISNTATITDADRVSTDPRSSVIAAFIVQTILDAVDSATTASPTAGAAIKRAILASLDSVIQSITSTINAAIDSGSMTEPDVTTATNVSSALKTATDSTSAGTAVAAAPTPPTSVTQAVNGAKSSSVALQACNTDLGGTTPLCTQAMAKLMYNALGFPVGLLINGGAFGLSGTCLASSTITPNDGTHTTLGSVFPNAKFEAHADNSDIPGEYCAVQPLVAAPDRNRGYQNDGGHNGPVFAESGTGAIQTGVLSAMGASLMANNTYNLASIDSLIFGSTAGAGMNARLINRQFTAAAGQGTDSFLYYNGSAWVNTGWVNTCSVGGYNPGSGSSICSPGGLFNFASGAWTSSSTNSSLATSIGAGSDTGLSVMYHKFGGPIPAQSSIDSFIDEGRTHVDYNTKGEREIQLVTTQFPGFSASNPCWDNDASTPCLDAGGTALAAMKVDLAFSGTTSQPGVKAISAITLNASTGAYYLRPYYGMNGFSGILGFVKVSDGLIVRDEMMRDRAVKIVFTTADCNANGLPTTGAGCAVNKIYNVAIDWSNCGGGGGNCPAFKGVNPTAITATTLSLAIQSNYKTMGQTYCSGGNCWNHQLLGLGQFGNMNPYKFTVAVVGTAHDTLTYVGTGLASGASEFNLAAHFDCTSPPCVASGFYLVDGLGAAHTGDGVVANIGHPGGTWTNVEIYSEANVNAAAGADYDGMGGTDIALAAANYNIASGPIRNPNFQCDAEPFFTDGNGNGQLDCEVSGGFSQTVASSNDRSFSSMDEYQRWLNDPSVSGSVRTARAAMHLLGRDNAFEFGDPVGTKKLMSTAFNGWFDGNHTLTPTTQLNALQVFGLLYMFMSQGGDYTHVDGLITDHNDFKVVAPLFENGNDVPAQNSAIGKAFNQFKTN